MQTDGAIDTATGYINEEVTKNFLHSICTVTSSNVGDNNWIVENKILTINQIAELYFPTETEQTRYKFACNAYSEYFDVSESEVDGADGIDRVFDANLAAVPLYLQYDPTWGGISYGNGTIRKMAVVRRAWQWFFRTCGGKPFIHRTSLHGLETVIM